VTRGHVGHLLLCNAGTVEFNAPTDIVEPMPECCKLHEQRRGRCGNPPECFSDLHASSCNGGLWENTVYPILDRHPNPGILGILGSGGGFPGGVQNTPQNTPKTGGSPGGSKTPQNDPKMGGWRYTKQCKFWRVSSVLIQGDSAGIGVRGGHF
jgi:hypothetical protein